MKKLNHDHRLRLVRLFQRIERDLPRVYQLLGGDAAKRDIESGDIEVLVEAGLLGYPALGTVAPRQVVIDARHRYHRAIHQVAMRRVVRPRSGAK